jgi:hypothetical protein
MTTSKLRFGYILFFGAIICLTIFCVLNAFVAQNVWQINALWLNMFVFIFAVLIFVTTKTMSSMIFELSGIILVLEVIPKEKFDSHIAARVKKFNNICYLTLEKSAEEIIKLLREKNIDTSKIYFIDATDNDCKIDNCVNIKNTPEQILSSWNKILAEKQIDGIFFDSVDDIKGLKDFEVSKLVGQLALAVRQAKTKGFLMSIKGRTDESTIRDMGMFLDEVRNVK